MRYFSRSQRLALYLAAGGRCGVCGAHLEAGWHAHHAHPFARGGATDVLNAAALCPDCHVAHHKQKETEHAGT